MVLTVREPLHSFLGGGSMLVYSHTAHVVFADAAVAVGIAVAGAAGAAVAAHKLEDNILWVRTGGFGVVERSW